MCCYFTTYSQVRVSLFPFTYTPFLFLLKLYFMLKITRKTYTNEKLLHQAECYWG